MIYSYSARNRLAEPHRYMYTPFEGAALLDAFLDARLRVLRQLVSGPSADTTDAELVSAATTFIDRHLALRSRGICEQWRFLQEIGQAEQDVMQVAVTPGTACDLASFSPEDNVSTSALLTAMVRALLQRTRQDEARVWLDRLVQRFEVTKRIYETYPAGFRKGIGDFGCLRRYWMLALALCLSLAEASSLRLLSSLLKVCDLLCSVDIDDLRKAVPDTGMRMVLAVESASVRELMINKGIQRVAV